MVFLVPKTAHHTPIFVLFLCQTKNHCLFQILTLKYKETMKNVRFFSNKMALVAVVVVSSIMMMSFKSTSTKKELAYSVKVQQQKHSNSLSATPNLTSWRAIVGTIGLAVKTMEMYVGCPMGCYAPDYLQIQEDDKVAQDKKMSEF